MMLQRRQNHTLPTLTMIVRDWSMRPCHRVEATPGMSSVSVGGKVTPPLTCVGLANGVLQSVLHFQHHSDNCIAN
jgi:hypothetical protein